MRQDLTSVTLGLALSLLWIVGGLLPSELEAQESGERDGPQWRNAAEISFLVDGGNSAASSLGLRNTLRRSGSRTQLRVDATALRTDATRISRRAVGSPDDFRVEEDRDTERSAERYGLRTRLDRSLGSRAFAFSGIGWEQNTFAGFNHRTVASAGAGTRWGDQDEEDWELKLGAGLTYTVRRDVTPDPDRDRSFAGVQVTMDYARELGQDTEVEFRWVVDGNAQEFSEVRGDLVQALSTSLTSRLALKTTLQVLLDNDPPVESVPLFAPGEPESDETVRTPLRRMSYGLSVALVITM
ncbi:MAG: DUF481 domain-containing protein [Gemmatimonadales bacterium]|nr:MAG: DUF481 domain-containing protein [Gemmatimonadales bacterium]